MAISGRDRVMLGSTAQIGTAAFPRRDFCATCTESLPLTDEGTLACGFFGSPAHIARYVDNVIARSPNGLIAQVQLGSRQRCEFEPFPMPVEDVRSLLVRSTPDCGDTWHVATIDADELSGLVGPGVFTFIDRHEIYTDIDTGRFYLAFRAASELDGTGLNAVFLMSASALASPVQFEHTAMLPSADLTVMTGVEDGDDRLYALQCDSFFSPTLRIVDDPLTSSAYESIALRAAPGGSGLPFCVIAANGAPANDGGFGLQNLVRTLSVVQAAPSIVTPTFRRDVLRVQYPSTTTGAMGAGYQTAQVADVVITETLVDPPFFPPFVLRGVQVTPVRLLNASASQAHVLWAELIDTAGFSPPDTTMIEERFTHVLHWSEVRDSGLVREMLDVWTPSGGFFGAEVVDDYFLLPSVDLPCRDIDGTPSCFLGDYKYGTYIDEFPDGTQRFFSPWTRPITSTPGPNAFVFGAVVSQQ